MENSLSSLSNEDLIIKYSEFYKIQNYDELNYSLQELELEILKRMIKED